MYAYTGSFLLSLQALSHTEIGSPEMAVCYANRSAAFFYLHQFEVSNIWYDSRQEHDSMFFSLASVARPKCVVDRNLPFLFIAIPCMFSWK